MRRVAAGCCLAFLLAGCGSPPPAPADHFYRLVLPEQVQYHGVPGAEVITVGAFLAEGLYNERALLSSIDNPSRELEQSYYHFWITSPPGLLRDYLVRLLRQAGVSPLVLTGAGPGRGLRIAGRVLAFERQAAGDQASAHVALELRVDGPGDDLPLLLREYHASRPVLGPAMTDVVAAFNAAVDGIYGDFLRDLGELLRQTAEREG